MTRERWLEVKKLQEVPMDVWFDYYREMGGMVNNISLFIEAFSHMIHNQNIVLNSKNKVVELNFNSALRRLYNYFDNKFVSL